MKTLQIELLEGFWAAICVTEKVKITNAENLVWWPLLTSQSLICLKVKYILRHKDDLKWCVHLTKTTEDERLWVSNKLRLSLVLFSCLEKSSRLEINGLLKGRETSFLSTHCKYICSLSVCFSHKQQETSIVCEPLHMFVYIGSSGDGRQMSQSTDQCSHLDHGSSLVSTMEVH